MANVQEYLRKILSARYGKDVRQSIHDSIDAINTQVTESEEAIEAAAEEAGASASAATQAANSAESSATRAEEAAEEAARSGADGIAFDNDSRKLSLKKGDTVLDEATIPGGDEGGADGISFDDSTRKLSLKKGTEVLSEAVIPGGGSSVEITTSFGNPTSDEKVPSEKLVKTELDAKASTDVVTTSANGLMSSTDKSKLDGIASGANKTTVDSALSSSSTNPVQNKVVNTALSGKASTTLVNNAIGTSSAYNASTSYAVGDYCIYSNTLWKCLIACKGSAPSSTNSNWESVSLKTLSELVNSIPKITRTIKTITADSNRNLDLGCYTSNFVNAFIQNSGTNSYVLHINTYSTAVFAKVTTNMNSTALSGTFSVMVITMN